jgi:hypothetical protein
MPADAITVFGPGLRRLRVKDDDIIAFASGHSKPATFWNRRQLLGTVRMRDQWSMSSCLKVSLQTTIYSLEEEFVPSQMR